LAVAVDVAVVPWTLAVLVAVAVDVAVAVVVALDDGDTACRVGVAVDVMTLWL